MTEPAHLVVTDLSVAYGRAAIALHSINLEVPAGSVVAILGPNGAGKTTLLRAISGFLPYESARIVGGVVSFRGERITRLSPDTVTRKGIAIIPERNKVFAALTVDENLRSVPAARDGAQRRSLEEFVFDLFPSLADRRKHQAGLLSGGERQMLAIGRALMLEPSVILADELSFGIAPILVDKVIEAIRRVNIEKRVSVLLVEQNAPVAFSIAEHVYILDSGNVRHHGSAEELRNHGQIREMYFGLV